MAKCARARGSGPCLGGQAFWDAGSSVICAPRDLLCALLRGIQRTQSVMFGPDDAFLNTVIKLLRRLPLYPMFGSGGTRLQPADVEDVGEAVARLVQRTEPEGLTVECGGPRIYSYEELLRTIARGANVR